MSTLPPKTLATLERINNCLFDGNTPSEADLEQLQRELEAFTDQLGIFQEFGPRTTRLNSRWVRLRRAAHTAVVGIEDMLTELNAEVIDRRKLGKGAA